MVKIYLTLFIWVLEFNVNWDSKIFKYCCNIPPPPLANTNETQILISWSKLPFRFESPPLYCCIFAGKPRKVGELSTIPGRPSQNSESEADCILLLMKYMMHVFCRARFINTVCSILNSQLTWQMEPATLKGLSILNCGWEGFLRFMWPLNVPSNIWSIAKWGINYSFLDIEKGPWGPPWEPHNMIHQGGLG